MWWTLQIIVAFDSVWTDKYSGNDRIYLRLCSDRSGQSSSFLTADICCSWSIESEGKLFDGGPLGSVVEQGLILHLFTCIC